MTRFSRLYDRFRRLSAEEQEEVLALPAYLMKIEEHDTALHMVTHLDFVELKIRGAGISPLISDYDSVCGAMRVGDLYECLNAIRECLVQGGHILQASPHQLREQLLARLTTAQIEAFTAWTGQTIAKARPYLRPISNTLARVDNMKYMIRTNKPPLRASSSEDIAVISSSGGMEAWDIHQHRRLWCVEADDVGFACSLFRDHVVTSYGTNQIAFIKTENGSVERKYVRPSGMVLALRVDPVHMLIILGYKDGRIVVVDMETGGIIATVNAHAQEVNDVAVAQSGSFFITASADGFLKMCALPSMRDIAMMEEVCEFQHLTDNRTNIRSVDISPDGRHAVSGGWDVGGRYDISVWDLDSHICAKRISAHKKFIERVRFVDNQRVLSGSWDGTARLFDLVTGSELHSFQGHSDWVLDISRVDQDRFLSTSKDGFVCVWDLHEA